jgi:hypothetical protein
MAYTFRWVPTTGQSNSFVQNNNTGKGYLIVDQTQQNPFDSPLYICVPPITFAGGNGSAATLYDFARTLATCGVYSTVANPGTNYNGNKIPTGGAFTLNGTPCGNYEFNVLPGGTTLSKETVATLFSSTQDISSWIICKGDLTIPSSVVLIPNVNPNYSAPLYTTLPDSDAKRRLFMVVYVKGNLSIGDSSSAISMTACGGNTSATGANIGTFNIPIANNIYYSGLVSPIIQDIGAAGGAAVTSANGVNGGSASTSFDASILYTGGGGSGNQSPAGAYSSGAGGSGSAFSGGAGGGSASRSIGATAGSSLGGIGGTGTNGAVGGTGNPGGSGGNASGNTGTGGVLVVICEGTISTGGGALRANGINSVISGSQEGGASGGGIVAVIKPSSTPTFTAVEVYGGNRNIYGGAGGNGISYTYGINS